MSELVNVTVHDDGAIVEIILNRPEARNALNQMLLDQIREAVGQVADSKEARVGIIAGEGKAFCAGMDLRAVRAEPERMNDLLMTLSRLLREIRRAPQPFIARVHGAAIGGGCGLMAVCDFSFTHPDAKIGYPEVDLGICPAVVAPWLVQKITSGKARQLLLAGGTITGEAGHELGLVSDIVDLDDLPGAVLGFARRLAAGGPTAMAATKRWLNELDGSMDDAVLDEAARLSARNLQQNEAQSRLAKLFDKD